MTFTQRFEIAEIAGDTVTLANGVVLRGEGLAARLGAAGAHALVVVGCTAGAAVDAEMARLWAEERYEEWWALDRRVNAELLAEREQVKGMAPYCPGYAGWPIEDQRVLYDLIGAPFRAAVGMLPSGMLSPQKSILSVVGLARHQHLERWARERLVLEGTRASFRFDGSTCCDMGRPLAVEITVELERDEAGWRIRGGGCAPAAGDTGCRAMCATLGPAESFFAEVSARQPLRGELLEAVREWNPAVDPAGCFCTASQQNHKWRLAYQTLLYKLEQE